jgi:hypothetical protein
MLDNKKGRKTPCIRCIFEKKKHRCKEVDEMNIKFKTIPAFFYKERDGMKPNTVRKFDDDKDERLAALEDGKATFITIVHATNQEEFTREITDVSYYDGLWIISWKQPERLRGSCGTEMDGDG